FESHLHPDAIFIEAPYLPGIVRTALRYGRFELAKDLLGWLELDRPYAEHSNAAARAAVTEAEGEPRRAIPAYADSAYRWERFGVVPERAFALLGQGRCLLELGRPAEALPVLVEAREIFEHLHAAPALTETDDLLARAGADATV